MERIKENISTPEKIPSKKVRLEAILKIIAEGQPSKNAEEAHTLVLGAFEDVENSLVPVKNERMNIYTLNTFYETTYENKKIYFSIYNRHMLFIGENGSIDIRVTDKKKPFTDKLLESQPLFAKENMELLFEKAGADGHNIWD